MVGWRLVGREAVTKGIGKVCATQPSFGRKEKEATNVGEVSGGDTRRRTASPRWNLEDVEPEGFHRVPIKAEEWRFRIGIFYGGVLEIAC